MTKLLKLFPLLIVFSLVACDENKQQPKSGTENFPQTLKTAPQFDSFQESPEIQQMKSLLAQNPNDFNALSALGDMYFESTRYLEAIQLYDRAIAINPMCADCFNDKGLALHYSGDTNAALASFDKATEADPTYVHAWLSKGFVLVSTGRYEEAVVPLNKVKELDTAGGLAAEADKFLAMVAKNTDR
jgi:tetratricopeptide (TPR) repeat protein